MAYKINLPSETMRKLWLLKTYCACPPIIEQVRYAVRDYLKKKEEEIGTSVEDAAEAIGRHKRKERMNH